MRETMTTWQQCLAQGFSSVSTLREFLKLPIDSEASIAEQQFKTRVPLGFAKRMRVGDETDPLLRQVLADTRELERSPGFSDDPLEELRANPVPGVIHKYHGRVLLVVAGACAINCRYCFRRHFPYQENKPGLHGWQSAVDYISQDESIHEVILSGGDPLLAPNHRLASLMEKLSQVPHLKTLRIHTRIPIVLPERIDNGLLELLQASRLRVVMVMHCNHAQELDLYVEEQCRLLQQAGLCLLNQSVLLAGVNDNLETLVALSHRLFSCGILPYYLHILDKVHGAAHFDVPKEKALAMMKGLQASLSGYLVPRLVQEVAGQPNKILVCC